MGSIGFSFVDLTGRVLPTGVKVIQRVSRQPVRWLCKCERCGSERIFDHGRVTAAIQGATGNVAQCDLSECRLFGTAKKAEPPTSRPDHSKDIEVKPAPVTAPVVPKPVPAPHRLAGEYRRYVYIASKAWGQEPMPFNTFRVAEDLKPKFFAELMGNVAKSEQEQAQQAELKRLGAELEQRFNDDFNERYGLNKMIWNKGGKSNERAR